LTILQGRLTSIAPTNLSAYFLIFSGTRIPPVTSAKKTTAASASIPSRVEAEMQDDAMAIFTGRLNQDDVVFQEERESV
jgi:hypothetical protein